MSCLKYVGATKQMEQEVSNALPSYTILEALKHVKAQHS